MDASTRSWTRRCFEATRLSAPSCGMAVFLLGSAAFAAQELLLGRLGQIDQEPWLVWDMWIAVAHVAILAYLLAAFVYYEQARDATIASLRPLLGGADTAAPGRDRLFLLGIGGVGIVGAVLISTYLSPGQTSYDPATLSPESGWHRVVAILMGFQGARLTALVVMGSGHLSDLATRIPEVDLLEPEALHPFVRLGLTGALLAIGTVAAFALFLVDFAYLPLVGILLVVAVLSGGLALFLPLRGVRRRIRNAKREELRWCRDRMRAARAALGTGPANTDLEELIAWEARIESISEWPIDASTLGRFGLYLMIPLGSWAGGALVERLIDSLLD